MRRVVMPGGVFVSDQKVRLQCNDLNVDTTVRQGSAFLAVSTANSILYDSSAKNSLLEGHLDNSRVRIPA